MSVVTELEAKLKELEEEKQVILDDRNAAITEAKETYIADLKGIKARIGQAKRMLKSSAKL